MNDTLSGKKGKVKVMYVRSDDKDSSEPRGKRPVKQRQERRFKEGVRALGKGPRTDQPPYPEEDTTARSPWKTMSLERKTELEATQEGARERIDPAQIRRQRAEETRVYGEKACQSLFNCRPEMIVRAWFIQSVTPRFREALRWLAANRKAYHVVDEAELTKVSGTEHHGGVCFLIKKRSGISPQEYLAQSLPQQDCVVLLAGVNNPHNLGGIMRSCAHFGVRGVVLRDPALLESGAAVRTAEGGAEYIQAIKEQDLSAALERFRHAGYTIVTTSNQQGEPLSQANLPARMVLLLGHEGSVLAESLDPREVRKISIDGTGQVEGLNISVASGVLLAKWWEIQMSGKS